MTLLCKRLDCVKVFFSEEMVSVAGSRSRSPSDRKPHLVAAALGQSSWPVEFVAPNPATLEAICRVHSRDFVTDVLALRRANGFGSIEASVARSLPYTCGACLDSSLCALQDGISASLTSGFHHAGPSSARGFCTFNGLMISAVSLLDSGHVERLAIVDCDYHYGDGTQGIIDAQDLSDRILHISFGKAYKSRLQAGEYLAAMRELRTTLRQFRPSLILYQAGADTHINDPMGGLLTTEQMCERDNLMFSIARELDMPLSWNLAGGYQMEPDGSIPRVIELHLNTFREALQVWGLV
jgi:acetoin utilization deacetylase AcuC-like enzyme